MSKVNLFAAAKKAPATTKKTTDKPEFIVTEEQCEGFSDMLIELAEIKKRMETDEARSKALDDIIKAEGKRVFIEQFQAKKTNPGSFIIKGENGGQFMVIVMDKYLSIDETRATELKGFYGDDIVTTKTEYKFDAVLLEKHMEALSDAINSIETIPDEDKAALIVADEKHSIVKGAIDRLTLQKEEEQVGFFYNIQPQVQLKTSK